MKLSSVIAISFLFCFFCMSTFAGNVSIQRATNVGTVLNLVFDKTPQKVIPSGSFIAKPNGVCEISQISITSKRTTNRVEISFDGEMAQGGLGRNNFAQEWMIEGYREKIVCFGPSKVLNEVLLFASIGKVSFSMSTPGVEISVHYQGPSTIFSIIGEKTPSVAFELRTSPPTNAIAGWGGDFFKATAFEWWELLKGGWMLIRAWEGWPADQIMGAPPRDSLLSINKGEHLFVPTKTSTTWGKIKAVER